MNFNKIINTQNVQLFYFIKKLIKKIKLNKI